LYKKVVEIDPKDVTTYNNWGDTLRVMGRYHEAIEHYKIAIEIDPKSAWAYNDRGLTYSYIGELELAIFDYSKALEINPHELAFIYNITVAKKKLNNGDTLQYMEKVRFLCANQPEPSARVFYALAGLSAVEDNSAVALEMLRQAADKDLQFVKECAPSDIAFESIRNIPEFQAIF
jgi:tetratricopeptide (TPR) repeat protein